MGSEKDWYRKIRRAAHLLNRAGNIKAGNIQGGNSKCMYTTTLSVDEAAMHGDGTS
jgi:hypothetical protein